VRFVAKGSWQCVTERKVAVIDVTWTETAEACGNINEGCLQSSEMEMNPKGSSVVE
jgi:hypothetical protein